MFISRTMTIKHSLSNYTRDKEKYFNEYKLYTKVYTTIYKIYTTFTNEEK